MTIILAIAMLAFLITPHTQAQENNLTQNQTFTQQDTFRIPELNGNINFGFDGSYREARLENNTWFFKGLTLNNSGAAAAYGIPDLKPLEDLFISAKNSNITILGCASFNYSWTAQVLLLTVQGYGSETVNLGLNSSTSVDEWSVLVDNGATFLAEGSGWDLLDDSSVRIHDVSGNVTVMHFDFGDSSMGNLSFLAQHYVILVTGVGLAIVVAVAALILIKARKHNRASQSV